MVTVDLLAIAVFAISGGLAGVRARLDIVGVVVHATATGLGGGLIRDVLIGATPPASLTDWRYLLVPLGAGVVTFAWHPRLTWIAKAINVFDAFGLGLFSVAGALKAMNHGLSPVGGAVLGVVTGVGGGVLRDLFASQVPLIFQKSELYAIPATLGAIVGVVGYRTSAPDAVTVMAGAGLTITLRLLAIWRGWTAPEPGDRLVPRRR